MDIQSAHALMYVCMEQTPLGEVPELSKIWPKDSKNRNGAPYLFLMGYMLFKIIYLTT